MRNKSKKVIKMKRAYEPPGDSDGFRVLVDRLWPRGIKKERLRIDLWLKDAAPSDTLRKWFSHDPDRWEEFRKHYFEELDTKDAVLRQVLDVPGDVVTFVYSARDEKMNNAAALKEYLQKEKEMLKVA